MPSPDAQLVALYSLVVPIDRMIVVARLKALKAV